MSTVFGNRRRAEEFAARVDGSTTRVRAVTPESSTVAGRENERLVGVVQVLRNHGEHDERAEPREAFAAELRVRLMTEAVEVLMPQTAVLALPPRTRGKRERRLVAAATAAIVIGGTAGMATAAQQALPGQALYPVKRGIEKAQVDLSGSSAARGSQLLEQAGDRLEEVRGLLASPGGSTQVAATLAQFTSQARQGAGLMMGSYRDTQDPKTVDTVRQFTARDLRSLEALSRDAPPQAQAGLQTAAVALRDIDAQASGLCERCSDLPTLKVPAMFLASAEVDRALSAGHRARLDNSHPVVVDKRDLLAAVSPPTRSRHTGSSTGGGIPGVPAPAAPQHVTPKTATPGVPGPTAAAPSSTPTPQATIKPPLVPSESGDGDGDLGTTLGNAVGTLLPDLNGATPSLP